MRNGDFAPTRFEAQRDAVQMVFGSKLNGHPENTVGLITMAEKFVLSAVVQFVTLQTGSSFDFDE